MMCAHNAERLAHSRLAAAGRRRLPVRWKKAIADAVVGVLFSLVVGVSGVVVQDRVSGKPWNGGLIVLLVCLTVGLLAAIAGRYWVWSSHGTMYSLLLQSDSAPDNHASSVARAEGKYMAQRSITRRFDPGESPVIDIREVVADFSDTLEGLVNDDNQDTGYHLATDLIMPAAIAVGYGFRPPLNVSLREINGSMVDPQPPPEYEWDLRRLLTISGSHPIKTMTDPDSDPGPHPDPECRSVLLSFMLTPKAEGVPPFTLPAYPCEVGRVVGVFGRQGHLEPVTVTNDGSYATIPAAEATRTVAEAIIDTLARFPNATVVLTGRLPKTVSFAAGWYLANATPKLEYPWRRIVPLGHIDGKLRPMWVLPTQRDPSQLLREAGIWT